LSYANFFENIFWGKEKVKYDQLQLFIVIKDFVTGICSLLNIVVSLTCTTSLYRALSQRRLLANGGRFINVCRHNASAMLVAGFVTRCTFF
jgi:hypothetical protein